MNTLLKIGVIIILIFSILLFIIILPFTILAAITGMIWTMIKQAKTKKC